MTFVFKKDVYHVLNAAGADVEMLKKGDFVNVVNYNDNLGFLFLFEEKYDKIYDDFINTRCLVLLEDEQLIIKNSCSMDDIDRKSLYFVDSNKNCQEYATIFCYHHYEIHVLPLDFLVKCE